jgi:leader peptidase (prepilin peptidase)/N-methyltransferase
MEELARQLSSVEQVRDPLLPLWAMEMIARVLLDVWLFCLGATVGSFLNVVVYRLPRGKNLAFPGSFCPRCGQAIRLSDNVPILSWVALRGRCRDCGGRISPRYLAVETLVATTFLVVLAAEYYLPPLAPWAATRPVLTPYDGPPFWGMYGLHLTLVTTIYTAVLIAADGFRVPCRLYGPALMVGLVMPLAWPLVRSLPATSAPMSGWQSGLVDGLAGVACGAVVAGLVGTMAVRGWRSFAQERPVDSSSCAGFAESMWRLRPVWMGAAVGVALGWQRALWMAPVTVFASGAAAAGVCAFSRAGSGAEPAAAVPTSPPEITAETGATPDPDSISDEVHIVSPPTEPTEPS